MYTKSIILLSLYLQILISIPNQVSGQRSNYGLGMAWLFAPCKYEFEESATTTFDGKEKVISQELYCDCGSESCSNEISYSHTEQWTHTVGGNLAPLEMVEALKGILSVTYSYSWGESATQTSTVNCEIKHGTKVWLTIIPKMTKKTGWGQKKCQNHQARWIEARGWVDLDAPVISGNGQLVGQVWCRTAQFKTCSR